MYVIASGAYAPRGNLVIAKWEIAPNDILFYAILRAFVRVVARAALLARGLLYWRERDLDDGTSRGLPLNFRFFLPEPHSI